MVAYMLVSHILLTSRPIHTRIINTMPWGLRDATPGWSLCFMTLPAICARTPTKARNALKNVIEQFIPEQAMRLHPQMRCTSVFSQVTFVLALSLGLRILQDESQNKLAGRVGDCSSVFSARGEYEPSCHESSTAYYLCTWREPKWIRRSCE